MDNSYYTKAPQTLTTFLLKGMKQIISLIIKERDFLHHTSYIHCNGHSKQRSHKANICRHIEGMLNLKATLEYPEREFSYRCAIQKLHKQNIWTEDFAVDMVRVVIKNFQTPYPVWFKSSDYNPAKTKLVVFTNKEKLQNLKKPTLFGKKLELFNEINILVLPQMQNEI